MELLVRFVAIGSKIEDYAYKRYVRHIVDYILKRKLIDAFAVLPSQADNQFNPVKDINNRGTCFEVDFRGKENGYSFNILLCFEFDTCADIKQNNLETKQLTVSIRSDNYKIDSKIKYLEKLKLGVKKSISKDWKRITWLVDRDSENLSIELYPYIYKAENLLRELISMVMNIQYGIDWWEEIVSGEIKRKHNDRNKEYKSTVISFEDVDDRLMSIDTKDLIKIIKEVKYKLESDDDKMRALFKKIKKGRELKEEEMKLLRPYMKESINVWKDRFSEFLSDDFVDRFNQLSQKRNNIMHNKLIDRRIANSTRNDTIQIIRDLENAISKLEEYYKLSEPLGNLDEIKESIQSSLRAIRYITELKVRSMEILDDHTIGWDYEVTYNDKILVFEEGELLKITPKVNGCEIRFKFSVHVNDGSGKASTIRIYADSGNANLDTVIFKFNKDTESNCDAYPSTAEIQTKGFAGLVGDISNFLEKSLGNKANDGC